MKSRIAILGLAALLLYVATPSRADEVPMVQTIEEHCFAEAMIGFDSVINARLNVPVEHAMEITLFHPASSVMGNKYSKELLSIILNAYLWDGTPHHYATHVFYICAVTHPIPDHRFTVH